MEDYRSKIKSLEKAKKEIDRLKSERKRVVFTNGCFDILHPGHTRYLHAARQLGDHLVVAVNSDKSVRAIKGEGRPILSQDARMELLAALSFVDTVVIFEEDNPLKVIRYLTPNILVKGGDWKEEEIIGAHVVKNKGGEVVRIPYISGFSTTEILKKVKK
ncbi:MAG: D-glycero-beta-D-manno-heptose 1-phosphate adenylyltransferase [Deltaproteobacteria bacterium]|nr:MAG: D-glycero-beta-D-manno-heptose 1-phosphate adenylyltransferase [Deltaproteobacteria bacterium]